MKACRVCSVEFQPFRPLQSVCGLICARKVPVIDRKAEKALTARRKEAVKTRKEHMAEVQVAFNSMIRARDAELPCVSCGLDTGCKMNAGHYRSVGSSPELRFDEANCHKQCEKCNSYLSANLIPYRVELIRRIGQVEVDRLEGPQLPKKYSVDELRDMKKLYRARTRELLKANQ